MKERPILLQTHMVNSLLADLKTMTRRTRGLGIVNESPNEWELNRIEERFGYTDATFTHLDGVSFATLPCPYGNVGDRLWVRETYALVPRTAYAVSEGVQQTLRPDDDHDAAIYRAGWERSTGGFRWKPSIHMPRWASRIQLEITSLSVERIQDISEEDALREGVWRTEGPCGELLFQDYSKADWGTPTYTARDSFRTLICCINGDAIWNSNEWVWVVGFKVVQR